MKAPKGIMPEDPIIQIFEKQVHLSAKTGGPLHTVEPYRGLPRTRGKNELPREVCATLREVASIVVVPDIS